MPNRVCLCGRRRVGLAWRISRTSPGAPSVDLETERRLEADLVDARLRLEREGDGDRRTRGLGESSESLSTDAWGVANLDDDDDDDGELELLLRTDGRLPERDRIRRERESLTGEDIVKK